MAMNRMIGFSVVPLLLIAACSAPVGNNGTVPDGAPPQANGHPPRIDFAAAAKKLGVKEAKLKEALGIPQQPPATSANGLPSSPPPRPDIKGAAAKLNVPEEALNKALGIPAQGDRPALKSNPQS